MQLTVQSSSQMWSNTVERAFHSVRAFPLSNVLSLYVVPRCIVGIDVGIDVGFCVGDMVA